MKLNEISFKRIENTLKKIFVNCSKDNKAVMNFIKEILWFDRTYYENVKLLDKDFELKLDNNLNLDASISFTPILISVDTLINNIGGNKDFLFFYLFLNPNITDTFKIKIYQRIENVLAMNNNEYYFPPVFFNDLSFEKNINIIIERNYCKSIIKLVDFLNHSLLFNTIETINIIESNSELNLFAIKNEIFNFDLFKKDLFILNLYLENLETMDENNEIMFLRIIKNIEFIFVDSGELKEYKNDSFYNESLFKELNSFINKLSKKMTNEIQDSLFFFFSLIEKHKNSFEIKNNDLLLNLTPSFNSFISSYKSKGEDKTIEFKRDLLSLSKYFNKNTLITLANSSDSIYQIITDILSDNKDNHKLFHGFAHSLINLKNNESIASEELTILNDFYRKLNRINFTELGSFKGINLLTEVLIHNEIYNLNNNNNSINIKNIDYCIKKFNLNINSREYSLLFLFTNSDFIFEKEDFPIKKKSDEISFLTNTIIDINNVVKEMEFFTDGDIKVAELNKVIALRTVLNVFLTSPKLLEKIYKSYPNEINKIFEFFENKIIHYFKKFSNDKEFLFDINLLTDKKEKELQNIIENKDTNEDFLGDLLISYARLISYDRTIIQTPSFIKNMKIEKVRESVIHNLSEYNFINDINSNIEEGNVLTKQTMLGDIEIEKIIREHIYNIIETQDIVLNEEELTDLVKTIKKETKFNLNF